MRPARLAAATALAATGALLALGAAEVALRAIPGLMPETAAARARLFADLAGVRTRPHPYLGFLYPPRFQGLMRHGDARFTFRTDDHGFRNPGPWPPRADVVVVGDSVTFGFGVPDDRGWVALLAGALAGPTVVNLALPGFGPLQYLRAYETFGAPLSPKVVLAGFFPANDFWDTARFTRWLALGHQGDYMLWRDFGVTQVGAESAVGKLLKTSYLYTLAWTLLNPDRAQAYGRRTLVHEVGGGRLVLLLDALPRLAEQARPSRPEFGEALGALARLDARTRADGGRLLVVLLPSKEYVYLPLLGRMDEDPFEPVRAELARRGLTVLDLTPDFRARAAAGERLFFTVDGHPNERGYALIADVVARYLRAAAPGYGLAPGPRVATAR